MIPENSSGRKVHILYFVDRLGPILGGGERVLLSVVRALPEDRFRVSLATFACELDASVQNSLPCRVHVFPMERTYGIQSLKMAVAFGKLLREQQVDIVQTMFESSDIWGGLVTRVTSNAKIISSRRDLGILRSTKHTIAYFLLAGLFDRVLAVSDQVRGFTIEADGIAPDKVFTVRNGITVNPATEAEICKLRDELKIPAGSPVITTVGNLRRVKGSDVLIKAAARVRRRFPDVQFLICGSPLEFAFVSQLRDLIKELDLEKNVYLLGGREDVASLLALTTIFVLPSRSEGFSNALVEAMASALPCVATAVGGNTEAITNGVNGMFVPAENPGALAGAICDLLDRPTDARRLGAEARITYKQRFTTQAMVNKLVTTYEEVLQS